MFISAWDETYFRQGSFPIKKKARCMVSAAGFFIRDGQPLGLWGSWPLMD